MSETAFQRGFGYWHGKNLAGCLWSLISIGFLLCLLMCCCGGVPLMLKDGSRIDLLDRDELRKREENSLFNKTPAELYQPLIEKGFTKKEFGPDSELTNKDYLYIVDLSIGFQRYSMEIYGSTSDTVRCVNMDTIFPITAPKDEAARKSKRFFNAFIATLNLPQAEEWLEANFGTDTSITIDGIVFTLKHNKDHSFSLSIAEP